MGGVDSNGDYRAYQQASDSLRVDVIDGSVSTSAINVEVIPTASCAAGAAIQFDIPSFADAATIRQIGITQLAVGTCDYTIEIWEKDSTGYTPGTYADHYLKIFSRDIDTREYNETIDQGLRYRDRDETEELHCRLVNNSGGTISTFNISIVA